MASKKDKFRKEVKKSLGQQEDPSMEGIVGEIAGRRTEKSRKETESTDGPEMLVETDAAFPASGDSRESSTESEAEVESGSSQSRAAASGDASGSEIAAEEKETAVPASRDSGDSGGGARKKDSRSQESGASRAENQNREGPSASSERIDPVAEHKKTGARHMARKRDSIYNVSSDIRLEDYTEADRQKSNSSLFKMVGIAAVLLILGLAIWQAATWLMAPSYKLAISNQEITAGNIDQFSQGNIATLSATAPVHIRFQWEPGELKTDYLKILVERDEAGALTEEAVLGRRPPRTASYIYFMGPLDSGRYRIQVLDASGSVLADRDLELQ